MKKLETQELILDKKILLEEVRRLKEYFSKYIGFICNKISEDLPYEYHKYIKDWLWERKTMWTISKDSSYFRNRRERYEVLCKFEEELKLEIRRENYKYLKGIFKRVKGFMLRVIGKR
jgi:hypothetical protein